MANTPVGALTALWNAAGTTFNAIKINVTNTASAAASRLLSLQISGVEYFYVDKLGNVYAKGALVGGGKPPTFQDFTVSGAIWTKPVGCQKIKLIGVGGGGGSGGVQGVGNGYAGSTGGGGSGFYGATGFIDVSAVGLASMVIGAGGTGGLGATPAPGTAGGNTFITIGATTYTWRGGQPSGQYLATTSPGSAGAAGGAGGTGTNVVGGSMAGSVGLKDGVAGFGGATGGNGGSTPFGTGGQGAHLITASGLNGSAGAGYGAGGGGSVINNIAGGVDGTTGSAGFLRFEEYY